MSEDNKIHKHEEGGLDKNKETNHRTSNIDPENYLKRAGEFDKDFYELYSAEPFLGQISAEMTKVADPNCKTAYVGIRKQNGSHEIILGYSPKFMRELSSNKRLGVLKHEIYHVVFQHIFHRMTASPENQRLQNWATDLAINSIIGKDNLPEMCLFPGSRPIDSKTGQPVFDPYSDFVASAKPMEASDYYYEELLKIRQKEKEKNGGNATISIGSTMDTMDDHDGWAELDPDVAEQLKDKLGNSIEKAMKSAARDRRWGSVPQAIQDMITKMYSNEIDWRSIVRNFFGRSRSVERHSTIKRINKKMPYIHPGVKRPTVANFACFIDQSGSMSDEDIAQLFGELQQLANLTQIDVFHFDTEIDLESKMVWKKGAANPKCLRTRCGGTDFDAIANFLNSKENRGKYSGAIILTDGYAPQMGHVVMTKILWVITEQGTSENIRPGDLVCRMKADKGKFHKS